MKSVVSYIIGIIGFLLLSLNANADGSTNPYLNRFPIFSEPYLAIIETGDTVIMIDIRPVYCMPEYKFKNKKEEKFYWKTVRDVKKTLPYAKMVRAALMETYEYIQTIPEEERNAHLKQMEKDIFNEYKPVLKDFTYSQAKMLILLIDRECNQNSHHIIKAFLGGFRAGFWQTFGRMFGLNLKEDYEPEKKDKDRIIERVCILVESGML
jgi:hypothetical protein